jgi:hypothetical protein
MATERAKRVYLSFFEVETDNANAIANVIHKVITEVTKTRPADMSIMYDVLFDIAEELKDPYLLNEIYDDSNQN